MRKKGIPEVLIRSVMSLYEGAKTGVRVDSVLSPFLFAVVIDVVAKFAMEGALSELVYADDLVLMSEIIEGLRDMFLKWK